MTRATTPTYTLKLKTPIDFTSVKQFCVTLKQGFCEVSHSGEELTVDAEEATVSMTLSQEETLQFKRGNADIQLRGIFYDGTAFASVIKTIPVNPILNEEVIT